MTSQTYRLSGDKHIILDLSDEDKRVLAGRLMEGETQSVEILWNWEMAERQERMEQLRVLQRDKVMEKAQAWVDNVKGPLLDTALGTSLTPGLESLLLQAYLTGWRNAPLGPRAIRP